MTTDKPRPEVGQTIYALTTAGRQRGVEPLTVTRVGRKWFYAAPEGGTRNMESQFDLETWDEKTYRGMEPGALTEEEYAERQAKEAAQRRINATGWNLTRFFGARPEPLTADQINAIAEIIEKGDTE